jgi:hypothetical protein
MPPPQKKDVIGLSTGFLTLAKNSYFMIATLKVLATTEAFQF